MMTMLTKHTSDVLPSSISNFVFSYSDQACFFLANSESQKPNPCSKTYCCSNSGPHGTILANKIIVIHKACGLAWLFSVQLPTNDVLVTTIVVVVSLNLATRIMQMIMDTISTHTWLIFANCPFIVDLKFAFFEAYANIRSHKETNIDNNCFFAKSDSLKLFILFVISLMYSLILCLVGVFTVLPLFYFTILFYAPVLISNMLYIILRLLFTLIKALIRVLRQVFYFLPRVSFLMWQ